MCHRLEGEGIASSPGLFFSLNVTKETNRRTDEREKFWPGDEAREGMIVTSARDSWKAYAAGGHQQVYTRSTSRSTYCAVLVVLIDSVVVYLSSEKT